MIHYQHNFVVETGGGTPYELASAAARRNQTPGANRI